MSKSPPYTRPPPLGLDIDRCIIVLNALYIGVVPKYSQFQEQRAYSNLLDLVWGVGDFSVAEYYAYKKICKKTYVCINHNYYEEFFWQGGGGGVELLVIFAVAKYNMYAVIMQNFSLFLLVPMTFLATLSHPHRVPTPLSSTIRSLYKVFPITLLQFLTKCFISGVHKIGVWALEKQEDSSTCLCLCSNQESISRQKG